MVTRRSQNRRNPIHHANRLATEKRIEILSETLKPVIFNRKPLDFSRREPLLRRLGLWDFVHLEFDQNIRTDLITQLIATYNKSSRCSYVSGVRIGVSRNDLALVLKLPVKNSKSNVDAKESEKSIGFVMEVVWGWMILHDETWVMPKMVVNMIERIKEGNFEKIDWAGLIWLMMETELLSPKLGNCYYAAHMHCLIKCQREELLREEIKQEEAKEEEEEEEEKIVKMSDGVDEFKPIELKEHNKEENRNEEQLGQCCLNEESNVGEIEHSMERLNLRDVKSVDIKEGKKQVVSEEVEEEDLRDELQKRDKMIEHLRDELQKRDNTIEHLHKVNFEEQQKRQVEVCRLERELRMVARLVEDYRNAFKETEKSFAKYRAHGPQSDKPLYKDVEGGGGLMVSINELEKLTKE